MQSGAEKLVDASLKLEMIGGVVTLASAVSGAEPGVAAGGAMMATGGYGAIVGSGLQAAGGLGQVIGTNFRAGWSNLGYGLLGGSVSFGIIRGFNSIMFAGGSVAQRAFNRSADSGAAATGLVNDAVASTVPDASPSEVECAEDVAK